MELRKNFSCAGASVSALVLATTLNLSALSPANAVEGTKGEVKTLIDPTTGCEFNAVNTFSKIPPDEGFAEDTKRDTLIERMLNATRDKKDSDKIRDKFDRMEDLLYKKYCGDWKEILKKMEREVEKLEALYSS